MNVPPHIHRHDFADEVVLVADLRHFLPWVHDRRFERCVIVGPPPALLSGCYIEGSRWLGLSDDSFTVVEDPTNSSHLPKGTVRFVECTFKDCEFQNFSVVGGQKQIEALRALFPLHAPAQAAGAGR
jgi:hypothetical protein